ncbi:MAG: putative Holliday junction resolvase [Candidatus Paceibacteria bacterium]|jgi:putative Holliday junction resolvase
MLELMKRMGIDFGSKKIGIAMTDDAGKMAFPHEVVPNNEKFLKYVEELVSARGIEEIVIGHSLDNKGKSNPIHSAVEEFITDLTLAIGIPVHLEPEQYTTQQAMHTQGRTEQTDAAAAALILDSFITKN